MTNLRNPNARMVDMSRRLSTPSGLLSILTEIRDSLIGLWSLVSPFPTNVTGDYTTTGSVAIERVVCTNTSPITVTLHGKPKDGDQVLVKRLGAQVTVDTADTKQIDLSDEIILNALLDGPHLYFSESADMWWTG